MKVTLERIEEATFQTWPAFEELEFEGWVARAAEGHTRRANSATFERATGAAPSTIIAPCEEFYRARGLPPMFRIVEREETVAMDAELERRGCGLLDKSIVMACAADEFRFSADGSMSAAPVNEWLALYSRFSGTGDRDQTPHRRFLERLPTTTVLGVVRESGDAVACGLGVVAGDACGFFEVVSDPAARRRGYGERLMCGLAAWGRKQGAGMFFLQVASRNDAARRLYAKLGMCDVYAYWYRVGNP